MFRYLAICSSLFVLISAYHKNFRVEFEWNYINYTWPSYDVYLSSINDGSYIEKNNIISGIKLWKDKMYLSVPRYRDGVPVTLTSSPAISNTSSPLLEPYPSWKMQKIGNCSALQNVLNMEIDTKGRMWVLDSGRVATMTPASQCKCPPRLIILDLENDGEVLRSYIFPEDVVSYDSVILKDIVIDHEHGGMAYIVDSDELNPGIIVYSFKNNSSWKVYHESMRYMPDAIRFKVNVTYFDKKVNINSIALSPATTIDGKRVVYFSPLSSFHVFTVPTEALIDAQNYDKVKEREIKIDKDIKILGYKRSQSAAMIMTNNATLYLSMLTYNGVAMWDSKKFVSFVTGQKLISSDRTHGQWQSSFAFDDKRELWCVTNRMQVYANDLVNIDEPNFRILVSNANATSYQYYENGTAPEWRQIYENRSGRKWNENDEDDFTTELPVYTTTYQYYEDDDAPELHENRSESEWNENYNDDSTTELPVYTTTYQYYEDDGAPNNEDNSGLERNESYKDDSSTELPVNAATKEIGAVGLLAVLVMILWS